MPWPLSLNPPLNVSLHYLSTSVNFFPGASNISAMTTTTSGIPLTILVQQKKNGLYLSGVFPEIDSIDVGRTLQSLIKVYASIRTAHAASQTSSSGLGSVLRQHVKDSDLMATHLPRFTLTDVEVVTSDAEKKRAEVRITQEQAQWADSIEG